MAEPSVDVGDLPTQVPGPAVQPAPQASKRRRIPLLLGLVILVVVVPVTLLVILMVVRFLGGGTIHDVRKDVDDVGRALAGGIEDAKEAAAEGVGVKTIKAEMQERVNEVNTAVSAANQAGLAFFDTTTNSAFPDKATLDRSLAAFADAVRIAKARLAAHQAWVEQNKDGLAAHGVTERERNDLVRHVASMEKAEQRLAGVKIQVFKLDAKRDWSNAGIDARAGDTVIVWARGEWKAGPTWKPCGPDGTDESSVLGSFKVLDARLMTLLARVSTQDGEGTGYALGANGGFQAVAAGTVQLRCNDTGPSNNEGAMDVVIVVSPQP